MRISKEDIPVKIDAPGAVARQQTDFGDASGYAEIGAEYFTLDAGTDLAPMFEGLEDDACQAPHWGYLIKGEVTVTYTDGNEETVRSDHMDRSRDFLIPNQSVYMPENSSSSEVAEVKTVMV